MPECVIITVKNEQGSFSTDMELSSGVAIKQLVSQLLDSLQTQNTRMFAGWKSIRLYCNGEVLDESYTLADLGIWDGEIIVVKEGVK